MTSCLQGRSCKSLESAEPFTAYKASAADLARERSWVRGHVDGVLFERSERNDLKGPFMRARQHDVSGGTLLVRLQPVQSGHAPAVAGREPREVVLRHRRNQVISDTTLVLEER